MKKKRAKKSPKYKKGDIVGVATNAMYELRITSYDATLRVYRARCTLSYMPEVKVGKMYAIQPKQILVLLGRNGKKFPTN